MTVGGASATGRPILGSFLTGTAGAAVAGAPASPATPVTGDRTEQHLGEQMALTFATLGPLLRLHTDHG